MEPLFDYEKLDVYRVELAFIALVLVLRFPNRPRPRRRSRPRFF